jgi:hypothetical protein
MGDLIFSYLALFIVAAVLGFIAGWFLRALTQQPLMDFVQSDLGSLRTQIEQARARRDIG